MNKEINNRICTLLNDWMSTRKSLELTEMKSIIESDKRPPVMFKEFIEVMGRDGLVMKKIFKENIEDFGTTSLESKQSFLNLVIQETKDGTKETSIGLSYFPVTDRSKSMQVEIDPTYRDSIIQIMNTMASGNLAITNELIKNNWPTLSLKNRNDIIEYANKLGTFNSKVDGAEQFEVPKNAGGRVVMKKLETKKDLNKDDYLNQLTKTAEANMKIQ